MRGTQIWCCFLRQGHPRSIWRSYQKSTFCTFLRRDGELHVLATTTNRKSGSNYGWVFSPNFDLGHPRSPKVNYQGKTPKIDFMYLFTDRWCVARSRNHHQSKERVKLRVGLSSEFWFRPPKVTQGQLSRKNTQNRLSVPFYGEMVRCTFSQPPPIERAGQTTGGSFLRILI